jgi:hypothetical protein
MGYLQLAENPYERLAEGVPAKDLYIFVPAGFRGAVKDMWIREDSLDGLSDVEYLELMRSLEPYQNQGMSYGFTQLSGKAERQARRDARKAKKQSKASVKQAKRDAKIERAKSGKTALDSIIGGAQNIVGTIFGGGAAAGDQEKLDVQGTVGGVEFDLGPEQSFFERNKTLILVGGVAAGGLLIYMLTKKR